MMCLSTAFFTQQSSTVSCTLDNHSCTSTVLNVSFSRQQLRTMLTSEFTSISVNSSRSTSSNTMIRHVTITENYNGIISGSQVVGTHRVIENTNVTITITVIGMTVNIITM